MEHLDQGPGSAFGHSNHVSINNDNRTSSSSRSAQDSNSIFLQMLLKFNLEPGGGWRAR